MTAPHALAWVLAAHALGSAAGQQPPAPPVVTRLAELAARSPVAVAHRGASGRFPENTLPAFRGAIDAGAPVVELDFRATADGVLVCLHDETLDRTTDVRARFGGRAVRVDSLPWDRVRELDAGGWRGDPHRGTPIPTLEEALAVLLPAAIPMVEHKAGAPERLVELLRRMDAVDRVLVQSFDWPWLEAVHGLEPGLALAALGSKRLDDARLEEATRTGARVLHWSWQDLTLDDPDRMRRAGLLCCVYTIDAELGWAGAATAGADAITTNVPGRLAGLIAAGRVSRAR